MKPTLVLWDIDGTLLRGHGIGQRSMEAAFRDVLGLTAFAMDTIPFHGNTDPLIIAAGLAALGHDATHATHATHLTRITEAYLAILQAEVGRANPFVRLPGAAEVVDALAPHTHQGLGTGNVEAAAWLKVRSVDLHHHFHFGGFGSDAGDRGELLRIGRDRGAAQLGVTPEACRVIVIGDTLRDIAAARAIDAEVIAVATGGATLDTLRGAQPELTFASFVDAAPTITRFVTG